MTEGEIDRIMVELKSIQINIAEIKTILGNGKGLRQDVQCLQDQVRKVIMALCFTAGGGGLSVAIVKLLNG